MINIPPNLSKLLREASSLKRDLGHAQRGLSENPSKENFVRAIQATITDLTSKLATVEAEIEDLRGSIEEVGSSIPESIKGDPGEIGERGPRGEKGEIGERGPIGKNGSDGRTPVFGVDFTYPQPPELSSKDIRDRLHLLKNDERLNAEAIQGIPTLQEIINEIKGKKILDVMDLKNGQQILYPSKNKQDLRWHGSGIWKLTAGSNVTITDTDPTNPNNGSKTISATITNPDHITADNYVNLLANNTTTNFYVATTGSDSNPGTLLLPFLTVQKAIDTIAAGLWPGICIINVADGTYVGNIVAKATMGKNTYTTVNNVTAPSAPNLIQILGNTTSPSNVILRGTDSLAATFNMENCDSPYVLNGVDVRGTAGTKAAFYVAGNKSQLSITNVNTSVVNNCISVHFGARFFYLNGSTGGTHAMTSGNFLLISGSSTARFDRGLTVTGVTISVVNATRNAYIHFNTTNSTYTFSTPTMSGAAAFATNSSNIVGFGSGDVVNINNRSNAVFNGTVLYGTNFLIQGPATFNLTDCPGGVLTLGSGALYNENNANTWNYIGTSSATYLLRNASVSLSLNSFSGAVPSFSSQSTFFKFGYDWRYLQVVSGYLVGAVAQGVTRYLTPTAQVPTYFPLYISTQATSVDTLNVFTATANGAAQSDVYTVVKNGVDTTMTLTITNGTSGSTVTNPVTLAAGDTVGIKLVTAAGSTAANVNAQLSIRMT